MDQNQVARGADLGKAGADGGLAAVTPGHNQLAPRWAGSEQRPTAALDVLGREDYDNLFERAAGPQSLQRVANERAS